MRRLRSFARALRQVLLGFVGPTPAARDAGAMRRALEKRAGLRGTCC
jgi:hypothetical protein